MKTISLIDALKKSDYEKNVKNEMSNLLMKDFGKNKKFLFKQTSKIALPNYIIIVEHILKVSLKGKNYDIPILIYFPDSFPLCAPEIYLKKISRHIQINKSIPNYFISKNDLRVNFLLYKKWKKVASSIHEIIDYLIDIFNRFFPLFSCKEENNFSGYCQIDYKNSILIENNNENNIIKNNEKNFENNNNKNNGKNNENKIINNNENKNNENKNNENNNNENIENENNNELNKIKIIFKNNKKKMYNNNKSNSLELDNISTNFDDNLLNEKSNINLIKNENYHKKKNALNDIYINNDPIKLKEFNIDSKKKFKLVNRNFLSNFFNDIDHKMLKNSYLNNIIQTNHNTNSIYSYKKNKKNKLSIEDENSNFYDDIKDLNENNDDIKNKCNNKCECLIF